MPMNYFFTREGDAALVAVLHQRPLIALDFDGTLTDIVDHPSDARMTPELAQRLAALKDRLPVAIVTGRTVDDVRERLGFEPQMIVGNHGAEDGIDQQRATEHSAELDPLRRLLRLHAARLSGAGIDVEDKGQSMALHYRLAPDSKQARRLISAVLAHLEHGVKTFEGKMVMNVAPLHAPDKAAAVHQLVTACAAGAALFAGDDVNDEPVFVSAPGHWLTIRVGSESPLSRAQYFIRHPREMLHVVDRILSILNRQGHA